MQRMSSTISITKRILASNYTKLHKLPERRLSLSTNQRFGGYAHVGDAIPHTLKHLKFQQHNVANQATMKYTPTQIQHNLNNIMCNAINVLNN